MFCMSRIELSLRSSAPKAMVGLEDLQEGQTVSGRVRRVEGYGVFITLAGSGVTGLCHISEVADEKVTDLPSLFQPGQGMCCWSTSLPESLPHSEQSCLLLLRPCAWSVTINTQCVLQSTVSTPVNNALRMQLSGQR